ncbi:MAG: bifunctional folylpolyglutamate synthase/dihydrofolate synthase [Phycisphaerales bacterium]|nr:bifunctional folylpolyglutamate synthase/dihydrofolate synthase [Phycisphaerales bacterium]
MTRQSSSGTGVSPRSTKNTAQECPPSSGKEKRAQRGERGAFVNHQAAIDFLDSRVNVERVRPDKVERVVWKLDRMRALLEKLGNPHESLKIVHIAGSKGKGSVCNMLECSLEACGYTTGIFTSPHLIDVRERVRISGMPIDEQMFDRTLEQCRDAANTIEDEHGKATYFELLTALSLMAFATQAVDLVVLETGIGGRLDCTNVITPIVCGLTSIQLEHTLILGDTLEKIAAEKAGIMKTQTVTISLAQHEDVNAVFQKQAQAVGSELKFLGSEIEYTRRFQSGVARGPHARVCVGKEDEGFEHISVPLLGMHQADNCALALAIILELRSHRFVLPERLISAGLEQINRSGRIEQIFDQPRIYIDGAHTPESVRETLKAVGAHIKYDSLVVIFGCASDKDVAGMLRELDRGADKVLFTKASGNPRAMDPDELLSMFAQDHRVMGEVKASVKEAINVAAGVIKKDDVILLLGSFYIAGEAKALFQARKAR